MSGSTKPLHSGGKRTARHRVPRALLRALRQLRYTAELEEELDDISGGRLGGRKCSRNSGATSSQGRRGDGQKPSDVTAALDDFLSPWLFPDKGDGSDPRLCPLWHRPAWASRREVRRVRGLLQLSGLQIYPPLRAGRGNGERGLPKSVTALSSRGGRFGPYLERDGARASLPKDVRRMA